MEHKRADDASAGRPVPQYVARRGGGFPGGEADLDGSAELSRPKVEIRERHAHRRYERVRITFVYEIAPAYTWYWRQAAEKFSRGVTAGGRWIPRPRRVTRSRDHKRPTSTQTDATRGVELISIRAAGVRNR